MNLVFFVDKKQLDIQIMEQKEEFIDLIDKNYNALSYVLLKSKCGDKYEFYMHGDSPFYAMCTMELNSPEENHNPVDEDNLGISVEDINRVHRALSDMNLNPVLGISNINTDNYFEEI